MKETEVVKAVRNWIKSDHPNWIIRRAWHFDVVAGPSRDKPLIVVECKGLPSKRFKEQRAIGQCLDYTARNELANVSCFIAVPKEFIYRERILKTVEYHRLPIGLLTVDDNGEVIVLRRGKESRIEE